MKLFKRSYLKKLWLAVIILATLSFIVGQFAIYLTYGLR